MLLLLLHQLWVLPGSQERAVAPKFKVICGSLSCTLRKTKSSGAAPKREGWVMSAAETAAALFAAESLCLLPSFAAASVPAMLAFVASAPVTPTHLPWR